MSRLSTASDVDEDGSLTMRRRAYSSPRNSTWGGDARKMSDQSGKKPPAAARAAAKARGRRSAVVSGGASPGRQRKASEQFANETVDLSGLTAEEQNRIRAVLGQARDADKKVSIYSRSLKEQQQNLVRKTARSSQPGLCPHCLSTILSTSKKCDMCTHTHCDGCISEVTIPKTGQVMKICQLCSLKRRAVLSSCDWRDTGDVALDFDAAGDVPMQGYGLVLVCGLKADGGALRTFVIHVINGSVADKASLLEGDEITSWNNSRLIGLSSREVFNIIEPSCKTAASFFRRRYISSEVYQEREITLEAANEAATAASIAESMLVDPAGIAFKDGLAQMTGDGEIPRYQHGRVKLKLAPLSDSTLKVTIIAADRLPGLTPTVPPSPTVTVEANGKNAMSTPKCVNTRNPNWNFEMTFNGITQLHACKLQVSVKTAKSMLFKVTLGQCTIKLEEALLDNSPQWYCLQPMDTPSESCLQMHRPPGAMCKLMMSTHQLRLHTATRRKPSSIVGADESDGKSTKAGTSPSYKRGISDPSGTAPRKRLQSSTSSSDVLEASKRVSAGGRSPKSRLRAHTMSSRISEGSVLSDSSQLLGLPGRTRQYSSTPSVFSNDESPQSQRSLSGRYSSASCRDLSPLPSRHSPFGSASSLLSNGSARPVISVSLADDNLSDRSRTPSPVPPTSNTPTRSPETPSSAPAANATCPAILATRSPSAMSVMSQTSAASALSLASEFDFADGEVQNSSVYLTLTRSGGCLTVNIGEVENISELINTNGIKLGSITGVGIKTSLTSPGTAKQKMKTLVQPVNNTMNFDQPLKYYLTAEASRYLLRVQVVYKTKRRFPVSRKASVLGYVQLPLEEVQLKDEVPVNKTLAVLAKVGQ